MRHVNHPAGLKWHRDRNRELAAILGRAALDDLVVDSTILTPTQIAMVIKVAASW
jgi:hypothetical protein